MGGSSIAAVGGRRTAAAFEQYASGRRALVTGAVFFLEAGDHLDEVRRIAAWGDTVIAPRPTGHDLMGASGVAVVGYDGSWQAPGDQVTLDGDQTFELQDYIAVPFISIVERTVVRQRHSEGLAAFFCDADTARDSGIFVNQLLSRAILLDSQVSFAAAEPAGDSLVRVHVTADGEYLDGADGLLLGHMGDQRADIEQTAAAGRRRGRAFARIMAGARFEAELDARPWFERYLAAVDMLRWWEGGPARPSISGFGGHLVAALDQHDAVHAIVSPSAPFLATGDGEDYVLVAGRGRLRLDIDEARAAECLIATGDGSEASALLSAELASSPARAAALVSEVRARTLDHGIDLTAFARSIGEPA